MATVKPTISPDLDRGLRLAFANQGGGRAQEMIDLLNRSLEVQEQTSTTSIFDQEILQLNNDGSTANLVGAGLAFEGDSAIVVGYLRVGSADTSLFEFKAPTGFELTLDMDADSTLLMSQNLAVSGASPVTIDQSVSMTSFPTFVKTSVTGLDIVLDSDGFATTIRSSSTAARVLTLPDITGTLATLADIAANNELSEILATGNITGANDISIDNGQAIIATNGGGKLNLRLGADNTFSLTGDSDVFAEAGYFGSPSFATMTFTATVGVLVQGDNTATPIMKGVGIKLNTTNAFVSSVSTGVAVIINSSASTVSAGVDATIIGGSGITASTDGFTYTGTLNAERITMGSDIIDASALVSLKSTTQGFLPPAMTEVQRDAISSPASGLFIYNSTVDRLNFFDGTAWRNFANLESVETFSGVKTFSATPKMDAIAEVTGGNGVVIDGVTLKDATIIIGGDQILSAQAAAEADPGAITNYAAHASGAVTVTSNAATDLDTTAAALATLENEVTALRASYVSLLAKVRTHGIIAT